MKSKLFLISAFVFFLALTFSSATVSQVNNFYYGILEDDGSMTKTLTGVNDVNAIGFICANSDCSELYGTLWNGEVLNSGSNPFLTFLYPTILQKSGYAIYMYKEDYFPYGVKATWSGNGALNASKRYLYQKRNCQSPIDSLTINHVGDSIIVHVNLTAGVSSPVELSGLLPYVPPSIENHYAVDTVVEFNFTGPTNKVITQRLNIPASQVGYTTASLVVAAGDYLINVTTNTDDPKCINSIPDSQIERIHIEGNRTDETLPIINIISPENGKTYTNRTILVNIESKNATKVYFNINNGPNITYNSPLYMDFPNGRNTLTAFAENKNAIATDSVTFTVNQSISGCTSPLPTVNLTSPVHKAYNNRTLPVIIQNTNADSVWFVWKGHNYPYTNQINFNFDTGFNVVTAYASNCAGTVSQNINFYINENFTCDTSVPFIRIDSPDATTYSSRSVLVDIFTMNATKVWFSYNGGPNIDYSSAKTYSFPQGANTLTAYAENPCGINQTSVTFTLKTSSKDRDHNNRATNRTFPSEQFEDGNVTAVYVEEEDNAPLVLESKKSVFPKGINLWLIILAAACLILLIVLTIVAASKR